MQTLIARGGPTTATELADSMMVTNGAITGFMNALEEEGLITRTRMPIDRRVVLVEATEKARTRFEKLRSAAIEELGDTFNGWDTDDLRKLQKFLDRLMIRDK